MPGTPSSNVNWCHQKQHLLTTSLLGRLWAQATPVLLPSMKGNGGGNRWRQC